VITDVILTAKKPLKSGMLPREVAEDLGISLATFYSVNSHKPTVAWQLSDHVKNRPAYFQLLKNVCLTLPKETGGSPGFGIDSASNELLFKVTP
jgi:hypothetical protein